MKLKPNTNVSIGNSHGCVGMSHAPHNYTTAIFKSGGCAVPPVPGDGSKAGGAEDPDLGGKAI